MADVKITTFPYSAFLRGPSNVLPRLDDGDVLLERRDEENLVLTSFGRFIARQEGMTFAAHLLGDVVRDQTELVTGLLAKELPWLRWLPDGEQSECVNELLGELAAGAETGVLEPFARALSAWRSTAEVWSDPELARRLQGPFHGNGEKIRRPTRKR
jgi:hypothetical protein